MAVPGPTPADNGVVEFCQERSVGFGSIPNGRANRTYIVQNRG